MESITQIKQPNHVSTARYKLSVLEMNILYSIINELQKNMSKDFNTEFKENHLTLELNKIEKNNNYKRVIKAVKSMMLKSVEYDYNIPGTGKINESCTNIVSGYSHIKNSKTLTIHIPSEVSRFLCYIGGGYTNFQMAIAISLNSVYSKRLYQLCCRWQDRGGFYNSSIEDFKTMINISDKYKKISHLKLKVLDKAKTELKQKADYYFSYRLIKSGRKITSISIKIHSNVEINQKYVGVKQETYSKVYFFLSRFFPTYKDSSARLYADNIASYGAVETAKSRFDRLDDDITSGRKSNDDVRRLLQKVILKELGAYKNPKNLKTTQLKIGGF